jgi:isoleucyl-tRNA synthetase
MLFLTACNTILSNFEAGSNYKDTKDPAIFVTFSLVEDLKTCLIAWTITSWTLLSNLAQWLIQILTNSRLLMKKKTKTTS